jgi:GMP synthase (glutamine-hydrolysing)
MPYAKLMDKARLEQSVQTRHAVVVRHVAFEDLGTFAPVLANHKYTCEVLNAGVDELEEAVVDADLAIVLGGPIGVYEQDSYPWLEAELNALRTRLKFNRPTLGICLGAQLIAAALGCRVYPSGTKELGWAPVRLSAAGLESPLGLLGSHPVLHWHGDTFDLPPGASLLASTEVCRNQAFAIGERVLGLQFHLEADPDKLEQWLIGHSLELSLANVDLSELRRATRAASEIGKLGPQVFSRWLDQLTLRPS